MARRDRKASPWIVAGVAGAGALAWWLLGSGGSSSRQSASRESESNPPPTPEQDIETLQSEDIPANVSRWIPEVVTAAEFNQPSMLTTTDFARLILAHIAVESAGNPSALGDQGSAFGLMQVNVNYHPEYAGLTESQKFDPLINIEYGSRFLSTLLSDYYRRLNDDLLAIRAGVSAYNAGQGNVNRALRAGTDPGAVTYGGDYTDKVLDRFYRYGGFQVFV